MRAHALLADRIRLPRWQRWATYASFGLLFLTGIFSWALDLQRGENPASATQVGLLRLHGLAAMLVLICFGSLLTNHVRIGWAVQHNRWLGGTMVAITVLLTITGYALYYAVGDAMRLSASWIHFCVGVAVLPLLPLHIWRGRNTRIALLAAATREREREPARHDR